MAGQTTIALTLRLTPYSETSQVARVLAPSGMMSFLARGIGRPRNAFQGPMDVLEVMQAEYALRRGADPLHQLTRARRIEWFPNLRVSLAAAYGGELVREVLLHIPTPEQDAHETLELALKSLRALDSGRSPVSVGARLYAALLRLHGLAPQFGHCMATGVAIGERTRCAFSFRDFGVLSAHAAQGKPDTVPLEPALLGLLRAIFEQGQSDGKFPVQAWTRALTFCAQLMELALGRQLRVPAALLEECAKRGAA